MKNLFESHWMPYADNNKMFSVKLSKIQKADLIPLGQLSETPALKLARDRVELEQLHLEDRMCKRPKEPSEDPDAFFTIVKLASHGATKKQSRCRLAVGQNWGRSIS